MSSTLVSASLLSADFLHLATDLKKAEEAGIDWHHVDVMDGHFVPNLTFGPPLIKELKKITRIPLDVHLMISNPDDVMEQYLEAGSDLLTFHLEASEDPKTLLKRIKEYDTKSGLSIKPGTAVSELEPYLEDLDLILVMSVEPGFSGQSFISESYEKLKELSILLEQKNLKEKIIVSVDGGVSDKNAKELVQAGVNCLVTGSYFYKAKDRETSVKALKN